MHRLHPSETYSKKKFGIQRQKQEDVQSAKRMRGAPSPGAKTNTRMLQTRCTIMLQEEMVGTSTRLFGAASSVQTGKEVALKMPASAYPPAGEKQFRGKHSRACGVRRDL